jgi:hypothetical protein
MTIFLQQEIVEEQHVTHISPLYCAAILLPLLFLSVSPRATTPSIT